MNRAEEIYAELKLRDRLTPGRTPWQTLRRRAEEAAIFEARRDDEGLTLMERLENGHSISEGALEMASIAELDELVSDARIPLSLANAALFVRNAKTAERL